MALPPPTRHRSRAPTILLAIVWLIALPTACLASLDLCDVGQGIWVSEQRVLECRAEVRQLQLYSVLALGGLGGITLFVATRRAKARDRPATAGWYPDPEARPPSADIRRYYDGRTWTAWRARRLDGHPAKPAPPGAPAPPRGWWQIIDADATSHGMIPDVELEG